MGLTTSNPRFRRDTKSAFGANIRAPQSKRRAAAMLRFLLATILLLASSVSSAETIVYEIYEVSNIGSRLIAKGKRDYSIADVKSYPYERNGEKIAEKLIELEKGYRVGARIFFEKELTGFGLLAKHSDRDFSWEWYNKEQGTRFRKLQGGTAVNVNVSGMPFMEELVEVKFLDDTILRFKEVNAKDDTHKIIIKAGSVFRFR